MHSKRAGLVLLAIALAGSQATCHQVILTAPPGSTCQMFANPERVPAHGGVSVISAALYEPSGAPVVDGTVVQFFTNLGRIDEQGKTNDGVARVNFISDGRSGDATITAISGGASTGSTTPSSTRVAASGAGIAQAQDACPSVTVHVGSVLPNLVLVTAVPQRLTDRRASLITANVLDDNGNPVANVPVIFTVDGTFEAMDSQGTPTFTDNNGQAQDVMRTKYDPEDTQRTVTVTATTSNDKSGTVKVTIN